MEYLKSGLKSVLGSSQPGEQLSDAETVERLVERVQTSTLLEDRRNACRTLKALSRKHRIEVGTRGMDTLLGVLETDSVDCEIVGYALDALCNICSPTVFEEEERPDLSQEALLHIGERFTEVFLKQQENVTTILGFLEEYDFKVRWPALKLLTALCSNRLRDIQEVILVSRMGVSKLMDLLGDSREIIRNDTLLLLSQLTKSNANIQKIVAFENAFDRVFGVMAEEGGAEGGVVVQDCLLLMLNLISNNTSNQNFFKEGSYIQRLYPLLELPADVPGEDPSWPEQRAANILTTLQVVRALVSPSNPKQVVAACQGALHKCGLVDAVCRILMASGVPVRVLTEAVCTVAESIRGETTNQAEFSALHAPSNPPREALVALLMSMVSEKQPLGLRLAILYCFQCFLYKNETGQAQLVQTLLPTSAQVNAGVATSGQLLCGGLFSHDGLCVWLCAVGLSHALVENPSQRERLLRVHLASDTGSVLLLLQVTHILQQCSKVQGKLGLLMLLSTWLSHCPEAVRAFISLPTSVTYLTAQAGSTDRDENEELLQGLCAFLLGICLVFNDNSVPAYSKEELRLLIGRRIGVETFVNKLGEVSRHEEYSKAAKQPQPRSNDPAGLLLDHEFCKLFKALEGMIVRAVAADCGMPNGDEGSSGSEGGILGHYKEVIREQDKRIAQLEATLSRLYDENTLLRARIHTEASNEGAPPVPEVEGLKAVLAQKDETIHRLEEAVKKSEMSQLTYEFEKSRLDGSSSPQELEELRSQVASLSKDQESLLELLADQDRKMSAMRSKLQALGVPLEEEEDLLSIDIEAPPDLPPQPQRLEP